MHRDSHILEGRHAQRIPLHGIEGASRISFLFAFPGSGMYIIWNAKLRHNRGRCGTRSPAGLHTRRRGNCMKRHLVVLIILLIMTNMAAASDWPIYKGNIFFTGNNDEITVKNNNLKWLYQATDMVYNPIISDGMVFFVDIKKNVYCLEEESGKLLWKINLKELSAQFGSDKSAGKVKYPLVKDQRLILTDNFVIYCLDKRTGKPLWARTGMRD
jgi:outer membrane protein assembly factor BamB